MVDLASQVRDQFRFFESEQQVAAFMAHEVPHYVVTQSWDYGDEMHACVVVAKTDDRCIVYCATGFGPSFPWSLQRLGQTQLGQDSEWCAYLYEAFVTSTMWPNGPPRGFMLCGPDERVGA